MRLEEAQAFAEHTPAHARTSQARGHETDARRFRGAIVAYGEPPEWAHAATHDRQALALAEELGMRPCQAHCHCLGMLYTKIDHAGQTRTELSTAMALYRPWT